KEEVPRRMVNFIHDVQFHAGERTLFWIVIPAILWILFEWRVRSENKTMMRLSALGTAATGLTLVVGLLTGSLVVIFTAGVPAVGRMVRPYAIDQVNKIDASAQALDQALAKKDWETMKDHGGRAWQVLETLAKTRVAMSALASRPDQTV